MEKQHIYVHDIIRCMNDIAPPHLAMSNDVIGLQVGRMDKSVTKILLALDASPKVIESAVNAGADMLITHHALLYRPATHIDTGTPKGKSIAAALTADLTIFNAHTNLDIVDGGVNDVLARLFGLQDIGILDVLGQEKLYKFVVYVPDTHVSAIRTAMGASGAGHIGNYSHCTFSAQGEGTFLPLTGADPFIGRVGDVTNVTEHRIETIVQSHLRDRVLQAVREVHPYEEMAFDWYPLDLPGKPYGIGRIGNLEKPLTLEQFASLVREKLGLKHVRFGGKKDHRVERVAVLGGSGSRWISRAIALGADAFVTSDCDHHSVADAWDEGLAVIDTTHAAMEVPVLRSVQERLIAALNGQVSVEIAAVDEDPFIWI